MSSSASENGAPAARRPGAERPPDGLAKKRRPVKKHRKVKSGTENYFVPMEEDVVQDVEIEYRTAGIDDHDPLYSHFADVFRKMQAEPEEPADNDKEDRDKERERKEQEARKEEQQQQQEASDKPMSRKMRKRLKRLDVAQLKQLVGRPDVVEVHDASATDPKLLVYLKAYRNTVPVPRHWCQKRKYLQGKRGIEKAPFKLPDFIADTGITKIREGYMQREQQKQLKQRQKDRMQPKLGKIDIDYQVLHDAFFKYQTKPKMTGHGDLYFEGKEFEIRLPEHKPGHLSEALRKALGMPDGAPPPWLINMQRYGPPPSYTNMKIPGLNAPIPAGASFGYHPGGWGKPPVDERGMPLYGDVFGTKGKDDDFEEPKDAKLWGEMEDHDISSDESSEAEMEAEETASVAPTHTESSIVDGTSSVTSTSIGTETPDMVQIKKFATGAAREDDTRQAFQTLETKRAAVGANLMGTSFTYVMPRQDNVEVSLNPAELDGLSDPELIKARYERAMQEQEARARAEREGVEQAYLEGARKQQQQQQQQKKPDDKSKKPHKAFKF